MAENCSNLPSRKAVITGGAGFIGSQLVERMLTEGYEVVSYDNFDEFYSGKEQNLSRALRNKNFSSIRGSILNYEMLRNVMDDAQLVFHLAAQPGVGFSFQDPIKTNLVNTAGTLTVIKACLEQKIGRLVFASSSSVYGAPIRTPIDENHPTKPLSVYGISKLAAENYCLVYHQLRSLPVVCLRYHTVYGPRQRPDMAIYKWSKAILLGERPLVYGDGTQARDFTYVSDIIDGTLLAAESEEAVGEVFNLAAGNSITLNEALGKLQKALFKEAIGIVHEHTKPWDPQVTHADITTQTRLLGYSPKISLQEGLKSFSEWFTGQVKVR